MVKPDAMQHLGAVLSAIYEAGLTVVHLRTAWLSPGEAAVFYAVHKDRPFFAKLQGQHLMSWRLTISSLLCLEAGWDRHFWRLSSTLAAIQDSFCGVVCLQSS